MQLEHHVLQQSVEQVTAMVEACRKAHQRMAEGLARRKAAFRDIRDLTENNVNHRFGTFLRRRRMKGAIKMDYGERELSMEVCLPAPRCLGTGSVNMRMGAGVPRLRIPGFRVLRGCTWRQAC